MFRVNNKDIRLLERRRLRVFFLLTLKTSICLLGRYKKFIQWQLVNLKNAMHQMLSTPI